MRNFLQYLFSIILWIVFGFYWYVVFQRQISRETLQPLGILFGVTVLGLAITLWWIAHNKRIAARGQRTSLMPAPPEPFAHDNLQRPVIAPDLAQLQSASVVTISLDDAGNKVYRPWPGGEA